MKKFLAALLIIPFVLCYVATPAMAITWVTANQTTVGWDAVTADVDGDPFAPGTHAEYEVYLVNSITDPGKTAPEKVGQTTELTLVISLVVKGSYWVGVRVVQIDDATSEVLSQPGAFAWSDVPADCKDGIDFGIRFFAAAAATTNLRSVSTP
jgi:hypothetical protein